MKSISFITQFFIRWKQSTCWVTKVKSKFKMLSMIWNNTSKKSSRTYLVKIYKWDGLMHIFHSRNQVLNFKSFIKTNGLKCSAVELYMTLFSKKQEDLSKEDGLLDWDLKDSPWSCSKYLMLDYFGQKILDFWVNSEKVKLQSTNNSQNTLFARKIFQCGFLLNIILMICLK